MVGVFAESTAHDRQFEDPIGRDINNRIGAIAAKCCPLLGKEQCSWTAADGLKFPLQQSSRWLIENQNHNSWSNHAHANDLFVFALDELMRCATINCPGSWHDGTQANRSICRKLKQIHTAHGARVVVDSAFGLQSREFLIKSEQEDPTLWGATTAKAADTVSPNRQATSLRQLLEHGTRMTQGQFPQSKDNFCLEKFGKRKVVLLLTVLPHDDQALMVGINQILNTFMSRTGGFCSHTITKDADDQFSGRTTSSLD